MNTVKTYKTLKNAERYAPAGYMVEQRGDLWAVVPDPTQAEQLGVTAGLGERNVDYATTDLTPTEQAAELKQYATDLFHIGADMSLGYRLSAEVKDIISSTLELDLAGSSPVTALNTVGCRTEIVVGGGRTGEDIEVSSHRPEDVAFAAQSIFQSAVRRVCNLERSVENKMRVDGHATAKVSNHDFDRSAEDQYGQMAEVSRYIEALDMLYINLAELWDDFTPAYRKRDCKIMPWGRGEKGRLLGKDVYLHDYRACRAQSDIFVDNMKREEAAFSRAKAQARNYGL